MQMGCLEMWLTVGPEHGSFTIYPKLNDSMILKNAAEDQGVFIELDLIFLLS